MDKSVTRKTEIGSVRPTRSGGRSANTARRKKELFKQSPWRLPFNQDPPIEPLSDEGVQAIHNGAMDILENIGIEFLNDESRNILANAGCRINDTNVKMDREWVMEMIGKAPSQFTITPRNPDHELIIGGKYILFCNFSSPPNYHDLDIGKKVPGNR